MDAQLKTKLVEALRSGKYRQTQGALQKDGAFCCLGVLCDVMGARWRHDGNAVIDGENQYYYLSSKALRTAGISENQQHRLYKMNDDGAPFPRIADWIEAHL